jgi:hypothetical protein
MKGIFKSGEYKNGHGFYAQSDLSTRDIESAIPRASASLSIVSKITLPIIFIYRKVSFQKIWT